MSLMEKVRFSWKRRNERRELGYVPYKNTELERDLSRVHLAWPKHR